MERMDDVVNDALAAGIEEIYMPNVDSKSIHAMLELEERFPFCKAMMGLHPCSVNLDYKDELKTMDEWFSKMRNFSVRHGSKSTETLNFATDKCNVVLFCLSISEQREFT